MFNHSLWATLAAIATVFAIICFALQQWMLGILIIIFYSVCFVTNIVYFNLVKLWKVYQTERRKLS